MNEVRANAISIEAHLAEQGSRIEGRTEGVKLLSELAISTEQVGAAKIPFDPATSFQVMA